MSNSAAKRNRPLSPNIQIYRPQLTSVLSIVNRITGVTLSIYAVALVVWLVAAATGPWAYATVQGAIASRIGQIALFGCTFAFFLHLCALAASHSPSPASWRQCVSLLAAEGAYTETRAPNKSYPLDDGRVGSSPTGQARGVDNEPGSKAMLVEKLMPAARARLVTIADDAPLIEAAKLLRAGTDIVVVCGSEGFFQEIF